MTEEQSNAGPFYRFASEHVGVGLHAIDINGRTVLYNKKMKQIEGFDLEEMQDRSILELFRFDRQESTLLKVLRSGEPVLNAKQTYWNRKGQEITTINDTYPVFERDELIGAIELARDVTRLEKVVYQPLQKYGEPVTFSSITAVSESMRRVLETAEKAAALRLPVLLIGESGTGKELIAEAIHWASAPAQPLQTLYCHGTDRSVIDQLAEDLQRMDGGTVYHERIDLLPVELQQQLLGILKEHGAEKTNGFIASVGEDPVELISSGTLLKELYYFFSSMTIQLEPLRNRKEDILPFIEDYFSRHRMKFGSFIKTLDEAAKTVFLEYDWPGNLKELELVLEEITALATTEEFVGLDLLPAFFKSKTQHASHLQPEDFLIQTEKKLLPLEDYLFEAEMYYLQKAMALHGNNVTKAAAALGMSRQNLQYRLRKMKKNEGRN